MAKYTIEIRKLIERGYHFNLDEYPIFDESYRNSLNEKILEHYWFREIGAETPDRFNFYLRRRMNEIMPYYNQLYISQMIEFDPLATDYFEERRDLKKAKAEQEGKQRTEVQSGENKSVYSDTSNLKGNTLRTDNLTTTVDTKGTKDSTNDRTLHTNDNTIYQETVNTTDSKTTTFCDDPQTQLGQTKINDDGSISNLTYATTQTFESGKGKKDTDGTRNETIDTTEKNVYDEDTTGNSVTLQTGTVNTDTDNTNKSNGENASRAKSNSNSAELNSKDTKEDNSEDYQCKGRKGFDPSELIMKYRKTFLNIDMQIIEELKDLFMEVY